MILELSSFDNAILRLDEGIQRYQKDITDTQIRDGLIQRFEFTYELSHKMLKRFLESTSPSPANIDEMAFQDLIRTGNEQGLLLSDWTQWKKYREMRSRTSHTYDESVALLVVAEIPAFLQEARFLNAQLHARNK
ncbi:nucleotidyltransferase [Limnobacter sp. SAORIC-690]|uniref:nucleotidyltransferase substrate binding protein n=1 Tax=Limnobacter sp. SAORIC-690 TaxID=1923970 RepID=UPI000CF507CA|nr:nucleotidyltransferase substrate binding protein [Limnobacter sp. SAORIC-690]PQJ24039.1 nucleotidyltransferase [Limnobacter sp. SAORIC-690]